MSEILILQALVIVCGGAGFLASLNVLRRYLELRHERRLPMNSDELATRLERIELTVEATAIEVERLSEANRFMAKLLAERVTPATPPMPPTWSERMITPH